MAKMSVDDKLGVVKFVTDEHESHIEINEDYQDEAEIKRLVMACPAELYKYTDGKLVFNHEGCLECGTCASFPAARASRAGIIRRAPWA